MILYASTTVDLYPFFIGHYPFPFSPGSLRPFLCSLPSSLPLLTRLPRYQVTVHLSEIADPDIAEVMRLASLLPMSSTPSSPSPPSRDLHVTGLRYRPIDSVPSHVRTLVSPTAILSRDSTQDDTLVSRI